MNKNVSRSFPHNFVQPGVKIRQPDTGDAAFWHSDFVLHFLADWNLLSHGWVLYVPCSGSVHESVCGAQCNPLYANKWSAWVHVCVASVLFFPLLAKSNRKLSVYHVHKRSSAFILLLYILNHPDLACTCTNATPPPTFPPSKSALPAN